MWKRLFCFNHDYKNIAAHRVSQQNLWKCEKCGQLYLQHYGIGVGSKVYNFNVVEWRFS